MRQGRMEDKGGERKGNREMRGGGKVEGEMEK